MSMQDVNGNTLLMNAILDNNMDMIQFLLERDADPYIEHSYCNSPAIEAMNHNDEDAIMILRLLHDHGVDLNRSDSYNNTPLLLATNCGSIKIVSALLDMGVNVNVRDCDRHTALMMAAKKDDHKMVQLLLDRGIDIDARDCNGYTAHDHTPPSIANLVIMHPRSLYQRNDRSREYMSLEYSDMIILT